MIVNWFKYRCFSIILPLLLMCELSAQSIDYSLLRQNDKIDFENLSPAQSLFKQSLGAKSFHQLSMGFSLRFQMEGFINEEFQSEADQTDIWFMQRFMPYLHYRYQNSWQVFVELNSSAMFSKANLSPVDQDLLGLNQGFIVYTKGDWRFLIGRQNWRLGSGRLVDVREGPNVRLSFDMAEMEWQRDLWSLRAFYAVPVQNREGLWDNNFLHGEEEFTGLYARFGKFKGIEFYALYKAEEQKEWNLGVGDDERLSLGLRHFKTEGDWIIDNEALYQFGSFGNYRIRAYTVSINTAHRLDWPVSGAKLGIKTELISGDQDGEDDILGTFDALYPRGAYFGRVARFGPSNLIDIHPYWNFSLGQWSFEIDYDAFWRYSLADGLYNPALILSYPDLNEERFIAHQAGLVMAYQLGANLSLELEVNGIVPGEFLIESGLSDPLLHGVFTAEWKL